MRKSLLALLLFIGSIEVANAASVSVSASSNYVTSGSKVTFYITVNGAAWQLSGSGSGATSGCSLGDEGVGDSGTGGNINKTLSVTCPATSIGQISFEVSGNVTDANMNTTPVSGRKIVVVQAPRQKDSNNNLASLSVEGYKLTPDFNADTLEYSVDVPSTVNSVKINASLASNYATLEGAGEKEVNEGSNLFEIKAISETGVEKTYKVTVNVKDENPINLKINNSDYTVVKNAKNLTKPETFEETAVKINDIEIPAFYNEQAKITLIGVKDKSGQTFLVIYTEGKNDYEIYRETKSNQMILFIRNIKEDKEGFIPAKIKINDEEYDCLKVNENSEFALVYATNILTGKNEYYLYDTKEGTYIRYSDEQLEPLKEEINKYKQAVSGLTIGLGVTIFLLLISLLTRKRKKTKKISIKEEIKEEVKEEPKKETKAKKTEKKLEEAKPSITEELEKKKAIRKKKEEIPEKEEVTETEEDMYDIFESDRKRKKKKK